MKTTISLNQMKFFAHHGVLEQERIVGNNFEVSLSVQCDVQSAIDTDRLDGTINYADLYDIVKREMDTPSQLLEHVAGRIVKAVKAAYPALITGGTVTVAKLNPPFKCQLQSVAITLDF